MKYFCGKLTVRRRRYGTLAIYLCLVSVSTFRIAGACHRPTIQIQLDLEPSSVFCDEVWNGSGQSKKEIFINMCGIFGFFGGKDSLEDKKSLLERMAGSLRHRGPDAWGTYIFPEMALGHTRLSIIDLSAGDQPMASERFVISFNGEIYNYIELRRELLGHGVEFDTRSDTEVILKAFEVYGLEAFEKLNGQFAFLLWDKKTRELIVGRDRFGIRPLYVLEYDGAVYFSSELKGFDVIDGYKRSFDIESLFQHGLFWNTLADKTVFEKIRSVPAGTFEVYRNAKFLSRTRYYEIGESDDIIEENVDDAIGEFRALIEDSTRLRLRSDVPVVAYLSGGIDSSITALLASRIMGERLQTFSISFEDTEFDESIYQQEMSAAIGSEHHTLRISNKDIRDSFMDCAYHFERPVFRTAAVPLFLLSREVNKSGVKVVLTGEGADEILYGYDSFKEMKLLNFWGRNPSSKLRPMLIKKLYPHLLHYKDPKQYGLMRMYYEKFLKDIENDLVGLNIRISNNQILSKYFNGDYKVKFDVTDLIEKTKEILPPNYKKWSGLRKNQFLEMKTLLEGYLLSSQGDRMSMAHSVEGRYPFLDHRIVEKMFYYSDNFKLNGFAQKYLLGKAFSSEIPESIINRPKKPYTAPDLKAFFQNGKLAEPAADFLSEKSISDYGMFETKAVSRFLNKFQNRNPNEIGYRDNMLITFILSCQIIKYWMDNPRRASMDGFPRTVDIVEVK